MLVLQGMFSFLGYPGMFFIAGGFGVCGLLAVLGAKWNSFNLEINPTIWGSSLLVSDYQSLELSEQYLHMDLQYPPFAYAN